MAESRQTEPRLLTWESFSRVILFQILATALIVVVVGLGARFILKRHFLQEVHGNLRTLVDTLEKDLPQNITNQWCHDYVSGTPYRMTVIQAENGIIICDSEHAPNRIFSLLPRPEVADALKAPDHYGISHRGSFTFSTSASYVAKHLINKNIVIRVGTKLTLLLDTINLFDRTMFVMLVVLIVFLAGLMLWSGKHLVLPLATTVIEKRTQDLRELFVANVSHELRTPLTAIKGFADTLSLDLKEGRAPQGEYLGIISRNSTRLLTLINDLLDLSVMDAKALPLHKTEVDTKAITEKVLQELGPTLQSKRQTTACTFVAPRVTADPLRLEQVLTNLIANAGKYTPEGGHILVHWTGEPQGVTLSVEDNGPGIPQEHQQRIFERFYRVDAGRGRSEGGTGLGLSIVKHIMENHGGKIWVESDQGKGSRFYCFFPG